MPGTRLVIHLCFLASLLCLVAISTIIGLCLHPSDHLCRPLLLQQGRWWLFGNEANDLLRKASGRELQRNGSCTTAHVSVAVADDQFGAWQGLDVVIGDVPPKSQSFQASRMKVQSAAVKHLSSVCSLAAADLSSMISPYVHLADLWICEGADNTGDSEKTEQPSSRSSVPQFSKPSISIANASMIITFPASFRLPDRVAFVQGMVPNVGEEEFDLRRQIQQRLHVTLWVASDQESKAWKSWSDHLCASLQKSHLLRSLPCLAPIADQQFPTLSLSYADWTSLVRQSKNDNVNGSYSTVEQLILAQDMRDFVVRRQSRHGATKHGCALHVMLPGASKRAWLVESEHDNASTGMSFAKLRSNEWIALLDSTETDRQNAANHVVSRWFDQLLRSCLNLPDSFLHASVTWTDGTIPAFFTKLWLQNEYARLATSLIVAAEKERSLIKTLPWNMVVSMDLASAWKSSLRLLSASAAALLDDAQASMKQLDMARRQLFLLRHNSHLMEPPDDFPLDQYAAILAPLIMPLLLPLLFGLWREVKRNRELREKKALQPAASRGNMDRNQSS
jgi:hypothetical protein